MVKIEKTGTSIMYKTTKLQVKFLFTVNLRYIEYHRIEPFLLQELKMKYGKK